MPRHFDDAGNEIDFGLCPYFQGTGTCESGCIDEPSCMTDRPNEGWPCERAAEHNHIEEL